MQEQMFNELFQQLEEITGISDIGYHEIKEGRLNPIYKTQTEDLSVDKWKNVHGKNNVMINDNPILVDIINHQRTIAISDTSVDSRSASAFFLFHIQSILIIPVIKEKKTKGIIVIASIGKKCNITQEQITKCEERVRLFSNKVCEGDNI